MDSLIITPHFWGVIISKIDSLITYLITGCQKSSKIKACETHRSQRNPRKVIEKSTKGHRPY